MTDLPLATSWAQIVGGVASTLGVVGLVFLIRFARVMFRAKLARLDRLGDRLEAAVGKVEVAADKTEAVLVEAHAVLTIAGGTNDLTAMQRGDALQALGAVKQAAAEVKAVAAAVAGAVAPRDPDARTRKDDKPPDDPGRGSDQDYRGWG